jgi:general secretion pathway protein J
MTLIELMVALAVFAVLGTLTYRGTAQMIASRAGMETQLQRWRDIGRAVNLIELEVLQAAAPTPTAGSQRKPAMQLDSDQGKAQLTLLGLSTGRGVELIAFRHTGSRIEWLRRADALPDSATESDVLLDNVSAVRWRFLGQQGWIDTWPATIAAATDANAPVLPRALRLELDLPDVGTVSRTYALR